MNEIYNAANQIRADDYERDLGRINLPIIFTMQTCGLSWKDRMACAEAILANNMAYRGMAKERDMMAQEGGKALGVSGSQFDRTIVDERSFIGVPR